METQIAKPEKITGITSGISYIFKSFYKLTAQMLDLVMLETRLAVSSTAIIIASSVAIAFLLMSSWIFLVASLGYFLFSSGFSPLETLFTLALINFLAILPLLLLIKRLTKNLLFNASRKQAKDLMQSGEQNDAST